MMRDAKCLTQESYGMEVLTDLEFFGIMLKDIAGKLGQVTFLIQISKQHTLKKEVDASLTYWMKCHLPPRLRKTHAHCMAHC
jgi:hypothetical protein